MEAKEKAGSRMGGRDEEEVEIRRLRVVVSLYLTTAKLLVTCL